MTNFQFLHPEFKALLEPAQGAERLVYSDPRACCMRTRHALEQVPSTLFRHGSTMTKTPASVGYVEPWGNTDV